MPPRRKNYPIKSYQFKLLQDEKVYWFEEITTKTAKELLDKIWSEDMIITLGESKLMAHKIINEAEVQLEGIYLPSRIRRGVTEWVGRIIRGQYKRMNCYYDCLEIIEWLGIQTSEEKLISVVWQHCKNTSKKGKTYYRYKKVMVEQTIQMIQKWHQKLGKAFADFAYIDLVKPKIKRYAFPYAPDDDQIIKYLVDNLTINLKIKLPTILEPKTRNDWTWTEHVLLIPKKIAKKVAQAIDSNQPLKPTLQTKTLKAGL